MGRLASAICVIALLFAATTALAASDNVVTATGKITSVNQENRKIGFSGIGKAGKIQTPDGATLIMPGGYKVTLTGFVTKDAAIKSAGNVATLKDIKVGDTVTIRYFETKNAVQIKEITKKQSPANVVARSGGTRIKPNPAERIVTIGDFATNVYLPWVDQQKRPSTAKGYRDVWECHLGPLCASKWLKDTQTYHVQGWLNQIGQGVPDQTIQRILRHANVNTTATYYIKTAADDVHNAMKTLENNIPETPISLPDTTRTLNSTDSGTPVTVN